MEVNVVKDELEMKLEELTQQMKELKEQMKDLKKEIALERLYQDLEVEDNRNK
jgi:chaperonin cofactor prefoldin